MTRQHVACVCGALLGAACWATAAVAAPPVTPQPAAQVVVLTDLSVEHGAVSGILVNKSRRLVRDVRLLIRNARVWRNERYPGNNNPGRAEYYSVPEAILPGESLRFSHAPSSPLPERRDGHFDTSVEVVGFVEVGE